MSQHCCELHEIVHKMTRHHFPFEGNLIPRNGVYLLFETGEYDPAYQSNIENRVSDYIQKHFSFCVLAIEDKWLGMSSPHEKIRRSGLWQVNELYKEPLNNQDFDRIEVLASESR